MVKYLAKILSPSVLPDNNSCFYSHLNHIRFSPPQTYVFCVESDFDHLVHRTEVSRIDASSDLPISYQQVHPLHRYPMLLLQHPLHFLLLQMMLLRHYQAHHFWSYLPRWSYLPISHLVHHHLILTSSTSLHVRPKREPLSLVFP